MGQGRGGNGEAAAASGGCASSGFKQIFSWDDFEPEMSFDKRYAHWRDVYASRYGASDFAPSEDRPCFTNAEFMPIGAVGVTRFVSSWRYFRRTEAQLAADARHDILMGFNRSGFITGRCGNNDLEVPPGGLLIYTNAEPASFAFQEDQVGLTGLSAPHAALANMVPNIQDAFGVLNGQSPAARHLLHYVQLLLGDDPPVGDPALDVRVETMLLDLIALTIGAKRDVAHLATERGLRAARLAAIKADIRENMARPGFSIASVAKRQGVSPRYIHILFETEGKTFTEYVHERRLKEAYRMLTNPAYAARRIGDIAYAVGFSEQSTFNRLFRAAYGATPTEVRKHAMGA